jgi:aminomethyltransferase
MLLRTPFYDFHVSAGAKMVPYAGWEMPLLYRGIVPEHLHTRSHVSLFDVSHMGRVRFGGKDVIAYLNLLLTRNITAQKVGNNWYSLVCNEKGGVLDDVMISRHENDWLIVCNASNRLKLLDHFRAAIGTMNVTIDDQTEKTAMVAVQGPEALDRLAGVLPVDVKSMKRHTFETAEAMFVRFTVFRGGYTGEPGVEIILSAKAAAMAMKMLGGKLVKPDATLQPAGLGARDTLRLEAGLPLYGHELSEEIDPLSAGLAFAVDLNKEFIGAVALRAIAQAGVKKKLVALELEGRRIARQGTAILRDSRPAGEVTSGTFGPSVQRSIAMAYVNADDATVGTVLSAEISGETIAATVIRPPFYKRPAI